MIRRDNKKPVKYYLILAIAGVFVVLAAVFLFIRLEGEKPRIDFSAANEYLGISQTLTLTVTDEKSGIRSIWAGLVQGGKEAVLYETDFSDSATLLGGNRFQETVSFEVVPRKIGITDGPAVFRIQAKDFSFRRWFNGNLTHVDIPVIVDTRAPTIEVLTRAHNITQGGCGLVIYRQSEPCAKTGVYVDDLFFPGFPGYFKEDDLYLSFFALPFDKGRGTRILLSATDHAGNETRSGIPHYIRQKRFKTDALTISDRFLDWKMPEFDVESAPEDGNLGKFLMVNQVLRVENARQLLETARLSEPVMYWDGAFVRMPNTAPMASFADHREYLYQGRKIDEQYHLGVDLASVAHAPVPAANSGRVVMVDTIGIYGRTVVIDHGFGLMSHYAHLSSYNVAEGDRVSKNDIIGQTGITGLAGGDHLHFGMTLFDAFVNPLEWWDPVWLDHNVLSKLEQFERR